jgi:hypothetical protein
LPTAVGRHAPILLSRSRLTVEAPGFHPETPNPAERCVRFGGNCAEVQSVASGRHDSFLPTHFSQGFSRRETDSNPGLADHGRVLAQYAGAVRPVLQGHKACLSGKSSRARGPRCVTLGP